MLLNIVLSKRRCTTTVNNVPSTEKKPNMAQSSFLLSLKRQSSPMLKLNEDGEGGKMEIMGKIHVWHITLS